VVATAERGAGAAATRGFGTARTTGAGACIGGGGAVVTGVIVATATQRGALLARAVVGAGGADDGATSTPSSATCTPSTASHSPARASLRGQGGRRSERIGQWCHQRSIRMKLATYKDGSRDGQLLVVSRDLQSAHFATGIATRMQQLLDDWNFVSPQLEDLYQTLNQGKSRHAFAFEPGKCMAPLPRAFQWADGSAYPNHIHWISRSQGKEAPADFMSDPRVYQGGSDDLLGPCDDAVFADSGWGIDFEAELAVVTGDVAMGASPDAALEGVRLLMLANDWSLRELIPAELAKLFGFLQSKPATAFAPVAVTPDELGSAWRGGRAHLKVDVHWNGVRVAHLDGGAEMSLHFGQVVAHLAKTRRVRAGSIVGSGTLSQHDSASGYGCIIEQRAREIVEHGEARTPYMTFGDRIRIEAIGDDGQSVFGAIDQRVSSLR
jgi:fumarylacetoacetate (FAA) hydrolase